MQCGSKTQADEYLLKKLLQKYASEHSFTETLKLVTDVFGELDPDYDDKFVDEKETNNE